VRLLQRDVCADYAGEGNAVVEIEIYEHWLEPGDQS